MTPIITEEAKKWSVIVAEVCKEAMANMAFGVQLVKKSLENEEVEVAVVGGVIQDELMLELFIEHLPGVKVREQLMSPAHGAVTLGFAEMGIVF